MYDPEHVDQDMATKNNSSDDIVENWPSSSQFFQSYRQRQEAFALSLNYILGNFASVEENQYDRADENSQIEETHMKQDHTRKETESCQHELLEDWPEVRHQKLPRKVVIFSETSLLHSYYSDPFYPKNMTYTKFDRRAFSEEMIAEAVRIKQILESRTYDSMCSLRNHLEINGVASEEIVGIEQLALENSPARMLKIRRSQIKAILLEQEYQRRSGRNNSDRLASLSAYLSEKSVAQARSRASAHDSLSGLSRSADRT